MVEIADGKHAILFIFLTILLGMGIFLPILEEAFSTEERSPSFDESNIVDFDSESTDDLDLFTIGGNNFFIKFLNIVFIGLGNMPFWLDSLLWVIRIVIIAISIDIILP